MNNTYQQAIAIIKNLVNIFVCKEKTYCNSIEYSLNIKDGFDFLDYSITEEEYEILKEAGIHTIDKTNSN